MRKGLIITTFAAAALLIPASVRAAIEHGLVISIPDSPSHRNRPVVFQVHAEDTEFAREYVVRAAIFADGAPCVGEISTRHYTTGEPQDYGSSPVGFSVPADEAEFVTFTIAKPRRSGDEWLLPNWFADGKSKVVARTPGEMLQLQTLFNPDYGSHLSCVFVISLNGVD